MMDNPIELADTFLSRLLKNALRNMSTDLRQIFHWWTFLFSNHMAGNRMQLNPTTVQSEGQVLSNEMWSSKTTGHVTGNQEAGTESLLRPIHNCQSIMGLMSSIIQPNFSFLPEDCANWCLVSSYKVSAHLHKKWIDMKSERRAPPQHLLSGNKKSGSARLCRLMSSIILPNVRSIGWIL